MFIYSILSFNTCKGAKLKMSIRKSPSSNKPTNRRRKKWRRKPHGRGYKRVEAREKKENNVHNDGLNAHTRRLRFIGAYRSSHSRH
jgi:hypothetical protein